MVPASLISPLTKIAQSITLALNGNIVSFLYTQPGSCLHNSEDLPQGQYGPQPAEWALLWSISVVSLPTRKESVGRGLWGQKDVLDTEEMMDTCWFTKGKDCSFSWVDFCLHSKTYYCPDHKVFCFFVCFLLLYLNAFLVYPLYLLWKCYSATCNSHKYFSQSVTFSLYS